MRNSKVPVHCYNLREGKKKYVLQDVWSTDFGSYEFLSEMRNQSNYKRTGDTNTVSTAGATDANAARAVGAADTTDADAARAAGTADTAGVIGTTDTTDAAAAEATGATNTTDTAGTAATGIESGEKEPDSDCDRCFKRCSCGTACRSSLVCIFEG